MVDIWAQDFLKSPFFHWQNSQIKTERLRHSFVAFLENIAWNPSSVQGLPWGVNNDDGAKVLLLGEDFAVVLLLLGHCATAAWRIGHTRAVFSKAQWIFFDYLCLFLMIYLIFLFDMGFRHFGRLAYPHELEQKLLLSAR